MEHKRESYESIDEYIESFPEEIKEILKKLRKAIKESAPEAEELISYGIPTYDLDGKHLVHFAAFKVHIGFFPTPSPIIFFKKELKEYKTSKGTIQFPINKPVPYELIMKIVRYRVKEVSRNYKV